MHAALAASHECEFLIPGDSAVGDGEWVLAIFEVAGGRATAAAARASLRGPFLVLRFELRDWRRLREFAAPQKADRPAGDAALAPDEPDDIDDAPPTTRPSAVMPMQQALQGKPPVILLVDPDRDIAETVTVLMETVGLPIECATSAEQALELLRRREFGLLLTEWTLPGVSGLELCTRLRHDQRWALLPILFLSSNTFHQDMMQAFAAGADDYLAKPFRASELGARIFALLRRARLSASSP